MRFTLLCYKRELDTPNGRDLIADVRSVKPLRSTLLVVFAPLEIAQSLNTRRRPTEKPSVYYFDADSDGVGAGRQARSTDLD